MNRSRHLMWLSLLVALLALSSSAGAASASPGTSASSPPVSIALPVTKPTFRLAGAYVHVANCQDALTGANGDHDINNWIRSHSPYGVDGWAFSAPNFRYSNSDVGISINLYRNGKFWGGGIGRCWGDDSNITDNFTGP